MTEDAQRLGRFVLNGDDEAFSELVTRHFDLVYSTALRQLNGDTHLAQDVAQSVFTDLARKARLLSRNTVLAGWLYEATRLATAKAVRTEQRRRAREQEALAMQELNSETPDEWEHLRTVLDAAMGKLSDQDRNAVLLHYFAHKDFHTVGAVLGVSSDAAQKRVSRALGKLRSILARNGAAGSASSLAVLLSTGTVQAAPAGLAIAIAKTSLAGAAATGPASAVSVLWARLASFKAELIGPSLLVLLLGAGAFYWLNGAFPGAQHNFKPLNLAPFYNGGLEDSWTPAYGKENNLAALGKGKHILKGVPFDVRGVLQLQSQVFKQRGYDLPERVEGIPAGFTARKIHLLHANSGFADPAGTTVASLVLHYSDGQQAQLDIRQQLQLLDWWDWPRASIKSPSDPDTVIAWRGRNSAADQVGASIRMFTTIFTNPIPEKEIQTIDYVSAMTNGAPFMVALTLEQ